jgi:hypothetical protein
LRAGPAAKDPPKNNRKQDNKNHEGEKPYGENEKILRPENHTKKNKFTLQDIEHEKRAAIHFDERQCKKNNEVKKTEPGS